MKRGRADRLRPRACASRRAKLAIRVQEVYWQLAPSSVASLTAFRLIVPGALPAMLELLGLAAKTGKSGFPISSIIEWLAI